MCSRAAAVQSWLLGPLCASSLRGAKEQGQDRELGCCVARQASGVGWVAPKHRLTPRGVELLLTDDLPLRVHQVTQAGCKRAPARAGRAAIELSGPALPPPHLRHPHLCREMAPLGLGSIGRLLGRLDPQPGGSKPYVARRVRRRRMVMAHLASHRRSLLSWLRLWLRCVSGASAVGTGAGHRVRQAVRGPRSPQPAAAGARTFGLRRRPQHGTPALGCDADCVAPRVGVAGRSAFVLRGIIEGVHCRACRCRTVEELVDLLVGNRGHLLPVIAERPVVRYGRDGKMY
jgi:hypothetical protein